MVLGPNEFGKFIPVTLKSLHSKRLPVKIVKAGQSAAIALKKIKRNEIRKGMVLVDAKLKPVACREFEAEILVLYHSTTISPNYQAVVHCGVAQQTAKVRFWGRIVDWLAAAQFGQGIHPNGWQG